MSDEAPNDRPHNPSPVWQPNRRQFLIGALGAAAAAFGYAAWRDSEREGELPHTLAFLEDEAAQRTSVFVAQAETYDADLIEKILEGLGELGVGREQVRGKNVLLKPNLVETNPAAPHINTHPAVILAAAEAFRRLDAGEVAVAEGQGHRRDSWLVLEESGLLDVLDEAKLAYTDLNHDDLFDLPNTSGLTGLDRLVLPKRLQWADLKVSLAKMKTHHWAGATLSMKNLFGILPGIYYGWPKNVLHQHGIENSIVDINQTSPFDLAIVDGIVGMEGDGPILGTPKQAGVLVMGTRLPSVDATCARIMNLHVPAIRYLLAASAGGLGPVRAQHIEQRGASLDQAQSDFAILDVDHLRRYKRPPS